MEYCFTYLDLLPYILLSILVIIISNREVRGIKNITSANLIFLILFFFSAIRVGIGYDYYQYIRLMKQCEIDYDNVRIEYLADLLMRISYHLNYYQLFFIVTSFIVTFAIFKASVKYSKDPSLSLLTFIFIPFFFLESLSTIRSAVAVSLMFLAFIYFIEKKYIKYVVLCVCAIGFHYAALIALILPLVYYFPKKQKGNIILLIFSFFIGALVYKYLFLLVGYLPYDISKYILRLNIKGSGNTLAIIINLMNLINLILWKRLINVNILNKFYINVINVGTCLWNVLAFQGTLRLRLSLFFLIFIVLLLPSYIYIYGDKNVKFLKTAFCVYLILIFSSSFFINIRAHLNTGGKISFLPYQTVFYKVEYPLYVKE